MNENDGKFDFTEEFLFCTLVVIIEALVNYALSHRIALENVRIKCNEGVTFDDISSYLEKYNCKLYGTFSKDIIDKSVIVPYIDSILTFNDIIHLINDKIVNIKFDIKLTPDLFITYTNSIGIELIEQHSHLYKFDYDSIVYECHQYKKLKNIGRPNNVVQLLMSPKECLKQIEKLDKLFEEFLNAKQVHPQHWWDFYKEYSETIAHPNIQTLYVKYIHNNDPSKMIENNL